ncbi:hypothetical protein A2U01_0053070, partial [Trifolium medium]|nr:hypothetical protein [Trifolium medium]
MAYSVPANHHLNLLVYVAEIATV